MASKTPSNHTFQTELSTGMSWTWKACQIDFLRVFASRNSSPQCGPSERQTDQGTMRHLLSKPSRNRVGTRIQDDTSRKGTTFVMDMALISPNLVGNEFSQQKRIEEGPGRNYTELLLGQVAHPYSFDSCTESEVSWPTAESTLAQNNLWTRWPTAVHP